jgi:hypothetical protein
VNLYLVFPAARSGNGLVRFPFCFFLFFRFAAVVKFLTFRYRYFAFGDAIPEVNLGWDDGHALLLGLNDEPINLSSVQKQLSFPKRVVVPGAAGQVLGYMAIYQPSFAAADLGECFAKRALPFPKSLDLGTDENDSGFEVIQEFVVIGGAAILRNNLDARVLILIGARFGHKTIIAAVMDVLQVTESETFPVPVRKFNKIVTGLLEALLFYVRLTSCCSEGSGFLAARGTGC